MIRDLNYGMYLEGTGDMYLNEDSFKFVKPDYQPFDKEIAYNLAANLCERRNYWERKRKERIE